MPWAAVGAIGSIGSGIANLAANSSANDRAQALQDKALQQWIQTQIPDPEQQKLALQKFVQQGTIDPKLEKSISANPSQFQNIVTNQKYAAAQNRALDELSNIGYSGGLRLQDKAALQDATLEGQAKARANREAISSDMARRGLGGSGFDVAAQLQGQQGVADQQAQNSLKIAANAQDRALSAIEGSGQLAGQYRNQDFGEKSAKASAQDKINLFNTQNLQDVQSRNNAALNMAQQQNLAQKQKTADQNVEQANYQQQYNKNLLQQQYDNQAKKAAGMAGQYNAQANTAQQQGQLAANAITNIGSSVSNGATALSNNNFWDNYFKPKK